MHVFPMSNGRQNVQLHFSIPEDGGGCQCGVSVSFIIPSLQSCDGEHDKMSLELNPEFEVM